MDTREKCKVLLQTTIETVVDIQVVLNDLTMVPVGVKAKLRTIQRAARNELAVLDDPLIKDSRADAVDGLNGLLFHLKKEETIMDLTEDELHTTLLALDSTAARLRHFARLVEQRRQMGTAA